MYDEYIKEIYDTNIEYVLKDVDSDIELLEKSYYEYLTDRYTHWFEENDKSLYDEFIFNFNIIEKRSWVDENVINKKHLLIKDDNLEEIRSIFFYAKNVALDRINEDKYISLEEYNTYKEKLNEYLPKVLKFNKEIAISMKADAEADLAFAANLSFYTTQQIDLYLKNLNDDNMSKK